MVRNIIPIDERGLVVVKLNKSVEKNTYIRYYKVTNIMAKSIKISVPIDFDGSRDKCFFLKYGWMSRLSLNFDELSTVLC